MEKILQNLPAQHPAHDPAIRRSLLEQSRAAAKTAHAPYSNFHVGAAFIAADGRIFTGANVETHRPEGLICAERNAIIQGVASGMAIEKTGVIDFLAVSCIDAPEDSSIADGSPCGACRQVTREFSHANTVVLIDDKKDGVLRTMGDLLPEGFMFGAAGGVANPAADLISIEQSCAADSSDNNLLLMAEKLSVNAYAPLTKLKEAAIVTTASGKAWGGVSVDNSSTGLSISALRGAFNRGVLNEGKAMQISQITIFQKNGFAADSALALSAINPELMREFANEKTEILTGDGNGKTNRFVWGDVMKAMGMKPA